MTGWIAERGALLVVGATAGIGAAIWRLVAGGAARAHGDRGRPQPRRRRGAGRRAGWTVIAADVAQKAEVASLCAQIGETPLAGAMNNATMTQDALPVDEIPLDLFDRVFALNVRGLFLCLAREIAAMRGADETKGGGAIVNIASIAGKRGFAGLTAYSASKHAVIGLTRSAALDGAADGIRINALLPGSTRSEMFERQMLTRPGGEDGTRARNPLGRISAPAEQAEAALWLLSDAASFITGECLTADGGTTARC